MAWEKRPGGRYYYHSRKVNGRVVHVYFGNGFTGRSAERMDIEEAAARRNYIAIVRRYERELRLLDRSTAAFCSRARKWIQKGCAEAAGFGDFQNELRRFKETWLDRISRNDENTREKVIGQMTTLRASILRSSRLTELRVAADIVVLASLPVFYFRLMKANTDGKGRLGTFVAERAEVAVRRLNHAMKTVEKIRARVYSTKPTKRRSQSKVIGRLRTTAPLAGKSASLPVDSSPESTFSNP